MKIDNLSFYELRQANIRRLPDFKNARGELSQCATWTPAQWLQAVVGEFGEYANERKKFERGDMEFLEFQLKASRELADVVTYLDILAFQLSINLAESVRAKFNEVSDRIHSNVKLCENVTTRTVSTQSDEFDAVNKLSQAFKKLIDFSPVDDHYLKVRSDYEIAIDRLLLALKENGRTL